MNELLKLLSLAAIGAVIATPLVYAISTLLGVTHRQFRPILHRTGVDGTTAPLIHGHPEPSIEEHAARNRQGRR